MKSKRRREPRRAYSESNYLPALLEQAQHAPKTPGVYLVSIAHDDWCDLLAGSGPCNCDPEVQPPMRVPSPEEN